MDAREGGGVIVLIIWGFVAFVATVFCLLALAAAAIDYSDAPSYRKAEAAQDLINIVKFIPRTWIWPITTPIAVTRFVCGVIREAKDA